MVLADHKDRAEAALQPLAARLHDRGVRPDHLTWTSLGVAGLAGAAFLWATPSTPALLVLGGLLVVVNAALDGLDGTMARAFGRASARGDYLDHAVDRFADVLILGGLAFSAFVQTWVGLLALAGMLLTSYLGTQAQAAGLGRDLGGLLGRADRLALLALAPVAQALLIWTGAVRPWAILARLGPLVVLSLLDGVVLLIAVLGAVTVVQRFARGYRSL